MVMYRFSRRIDKADLYMVQQGSRLVRESWNRPTPYTQDFVLRRSGEFPPGMMAKNLRHAQLRALYANAEWAGLEGRCYEKFVEKAYSAASLSLLIAERREALSLIAMRAIQLRKAYGYLRKGKFKSFLKSLNARPQDKHRRTRWSRPRDASALWLEYWFAWSPMVSDIGASVDVLQSPTYSQRVKASTGTKVPFSGQEGDPSWLGAKWHGRCELFVRCQADVEVTNPNLHLANRLGFVNPASVAWELTPFSFLIDWFLPVGDFLRSFTDFAGLKLSNPQTSRLSVTSWDETQVIRGKPYSFGARGVVMGRYLTLLKPPKLQFNLPFLSATRAATAISLLVAMFTKG